MLTLCIKKKLEARSLRKKLVRSLCIDPDWSINAAETAVGHTVYKRGDFCVRTVRCPFLFFRILDRVEVYYKGNDLWFPLLSRLRIRCALRYRSLTDANSDPTV